MEVLELTVLKNTPGNKDRERKQSKSEYLSFFKVVLSDIMLLLKLCIGHYQQETIICRLMQLYIIHKDNNYATTVEPRLSGPSIIRNLDYPAWQFSCYQIRKWAVSLKRACALQLLHMETCLLIFYACADNHVALLFINKVGGSRRGLSIRLSGIFTYPACFWNQDVRIIEVLTVL